MQPFLRKKLTLALASTAMLIAVGYASAAAPAGVKAATTPTRNTGTPATSTTTTTSTPVPVGALLFGDEFNGAAGSKPSATLWGVKTSKSGGSLAYWNGWNQISEDGRGDVVITAVKNGSVWDTGWLSGKIGYTGARYIEGRAKVACGTGTWSAPLWEWDYPYGASGLENDVIEQLGRQSQSYQVHVHNWTVSPQKSAGGPLGTRQTLCNAFHTYGAAVYSDHIDYYLDGSKVSTISASAVGLGNLSTYKEVANIDLNVGGWGGTPTSSGPFSMLVDWIHVYKLA